LEGDSYLPAGIGDLATSLTDCAGLKKKYVSNTTGTTNGIPLVRHTPFKLITSLILSSPKRKGERIESNKEEGRRVVSWNVEEGEKYPGRWSICTGVSGVSNWKK
jgi:hypothetical protein